MRDGENLTNSDLLLMTIKLSIPTILSHISYIVMEYIDAAMVGSLGANATASIGLVSSSTWLFGSLCTAASVGFTVQAAQRIGGGEDKKARKLLKEGLVFTAIFSILLMIIGVSIHSYLPNWLGGERNILSGATNYFLIFSLSLPFLQFNNFAAGMLQSSGNMIVPGVLQSLTCVFDIILNFVFIFPSKSISVFGNTISIYGAGLGVKGAAIGTAISEIIVSILFVYFLFVKSEKLHLRKSEHFDISKNNIKRAIKISLPVAFEETVMCSAQIMSTRIVSPLGAISIAANSLAVTAESLCYMPGYGIGAAATTMIGQSIGAKRRELTKKLGYLTTFFGMAAMAFAGVLLYIFAPVMMRMLTPVDDIVNLGTTVLRIEAFAEPMYAASIVASGVFRGAGDTLVPSTMNFLSMWVVRIPISAFLASKLGLRGVWIAMCAELCFRGVIFLIRLFGKRWRKSILD